MWLNTDWPKPFYFLFLPLSAFVVDQTQAVKFALNIASGMAFLHTLEPMIARHYLNSKSVMVRKVCGFIKEFYNHKTDIFFLETLL